MNADIIKVDRTTGRRPDLDRTSGQPKAGCVVMDMCTLVHIPSARMGEIFISKVDRTTGPCVKVVRSTLAVLAKYYSTTFTWRQNMRMEQRDGGVSSQFLEKTIGGVHHSFLADPATWVDDDRVTCDQCQHMAQHLHKINMPSADFDKIRRENHIANQWMFDIVKIKNGWARVEYMGWQCNGGQRSYIPIDIKHRCDNYKPKQNAVAVNVKEWWE